MSFRERFRSWTFVQTEIERERQRVAFLNQPPPRNPPELFEPVKVKVIRPFYLSGELVQPGEVVMIERNFAESLRGIKVELVS